MRNQFATLDIRNFRESDLPDLYRYRNLHLCNRYLHFSNSSYDYLQSLIRKYSISYFPSFEEEQHFALELNEKDLIGDLSIYCNEDCQSISVQIILDYEYQGRGFAQSVMKAVITHMRKNYPGNKIIALIDINNTNAIRLFERLGFIRTEYNPEYDSYLYQLE